MVGIPLSMSEGSLAVQVGNPWIRRVLRPMVDIKALRWAPCWRVGRKAWGGRVGRKEKYLTIRRMSCDFEAMCRQNWAAKYIQSKQLFHLQSSLPTPFSPPTPWKGISLATMTLKVTLLAGLELFWGPVARLGKTGQRLFFVRVFECWNNYWIFCALYSDFSGMLVWRFFVVFTLGQTMTWKEKSVLLSLNLQGQCSYHF